MAKRTASAKKQARAGARRTARNRSVRSEVKTLIVKARRSLRAGGGAGGDSSSDRDASTGDALRSLDRAAAKGVLHRNNAARRKSRLAKQLARVAATASGAGLGPGAGAGAGSGAQATRGKKAGAPSTPAKKK